MQEVQAKDVLKITNRIRIHCDNPNCYHSSDQPPHNQTNWFMHIQGNCKFHYCNDCALSEHLPLPKFQKGDVVFIPKPINDKDQPPIYKIYAWVHKYPHIKKFDEQKMIMDMHLPISWSTDYMNKIGTIMSRGCEGHKDKYWVQLPNITHPILIPAYHLQRHTWKVEDRISYFENFSLLTGKITTIQHLGSWQGIVMKEDVTNIEHELFNTFTTQNLHEDPNSEFDNIFPNSANRISEQVVIADKNSNDDDEDNNINMPQTMTSNILPMCPHCNQYPLRLWENDALHGVTTAISWNCALCNKHGTKINKTTQKWYGSVCNRTFHLGVHDKKHAHPRETIMCYECGQKQMRTFAKNEMVEWRPQGMNDSIIGHVDSVVPSKNDESVEYKIRVQIQNFMLRPRTPSFTTQTFFYTKKTLQRN